MKYYCHVCNGAWQSADNREPTQCPWGCVWASAGAELEIDLKKMKAAIAAGETAFVLRVGEATVMTIDVEMPCRHPGCTDTADFFVNYPKAEGRKDWLVACETHLWDAIEVVNDGRPWTAVLADSMLPGVLELMELVKQRPDLLPPTPKKEDDHDD